MGALRDGEASPLLSLIAMTIAPATATVKAKKVIPPIKRPGLYEFGLPFSPDYQWRGGVYVCKHRRKELYFSCELPLCQNGDLIEVNSLYLTVCGLVRVRAMFPSEEVAQTFYFIVKNGEGNEQTLLACEFKSCFF